MFARAFVACAAGLSAVVAVASVAKAADPTAFLEKSSIVGQGETIGISRVPVRNSQGAIKYWDVTLGILVNNAGTPSLDPTATSFSLSPTLKIANFKPGVYTSQASASISVAGPGVGGPGGQTSWTLAATTSSCTTPGSATWYTGPIATNPLKARLQEAGITLTQYSYGIAGGGGSCDNYFRPGSLLGAQQVGDTLTLVSFTIVGSQDSSTPLQQITFKLKP